jgi:UDP-GlcNAc3NAcA epimerase
MTLKVVTVLGARPQFVKAAAVSRAILESRSRVIEEILVHTGQHHDANMSSVFFEELGIPQPRYNLEIAGGTHGAMTGRMLEAVESVLISEKPDWVLIYGDTNSTLAGALAAAKLHIPVAHVEAGLRSFNMRMPEEINRILSDRVSSLLFCPTAGAVENLKSEGLSRGVHNVGDVMYDIALFHGARAREQSVILGTLKLETNRFALATCHRAENTDSREILAEILRALSGLAGNMPVVLPLHPRTRKQIEEYGLTPLLSGVTLVDPLPFLDMIALEQAARLILTDSGGVQKEAFFYGVPCVTLRNETEWTETVELGWNRLAGSEAAAIQAAIGSALQDRPRSSQAFPYGDGNAATAIVELLTNASSNSIKTQ